MESIETIDVIITSTVTKRGRENIRRFPARVISSGDQRIFILETTFRDLKHDNNFVVDVGCQVNDKTGAYLCTECLSQSVLKKIHPVLITKKIL